MKKTFEGFVPRDYSFYHNLLFSLVEEGGLRSYMEGKHDSDGQGFKITINIERTDDKENLPTAKAQMP